MKGEDINLNKIADKAFEELKSETINLVVEHELHGVTPEMLDWWWKNMVNSRYYQLWHPKDHVSMEWEAPPAQEGLVGSILVIEERFGEFPARKIRIRVVDPASSPILTTYSHVRTSCMITPDNKPAIWITHEYKAEPYGTRMRSTFRLSAETPQRFIDALRQHNKEEMGQFPKFLPELYKQNVG
jgi:hypothetical protein